MAITFTGRIIAPRIEPNTALPYIYQAGESISAKEIVCKDETDGRILKASASGWTTMPAFGVAIQSKVADQSIQVIQFGTISNITRTEDFSPDDRVYVSTVAGKATKVPPEANGNIVEAIGRAINASDIILAIDETAVEIKD